MEMLSAALTIAVVGLLQWYFLKSIFRNFQRGTVSETITETPLWIPEALVTAGITIFLLRLAAYLFLVAAGGPLIEDRDDELSSVEAADALSMRDDH